MSSATRQNLQDSPVTSMAQSDSYLISVFSLSNRLLRAIWFFCLFGFLPTNPRSISRWASFSNSTVLAPDWEGIASSMKVEAAHEGISLRELR